MRWRLDQRKGALTTWRYWEPIPRASQIDANDPDGQLAELFTRSVRRRNLADVPVGVLFSGGVDSICNAFVFQREMRPRKVHSYTVGFTDTRYHDESACARRLADSLDTEHHEVLISRTDLLEHLDELMRFQDEPIADPVSVPLYFVTRLARQTGTIVLQAGEGADEILCGYPKYVRWLRTPTVYCGNDCNGCRHRSRWPCHRCCSRSREI